MHSGGLVKTWFQCSIVYRPSVRSRPSKAAISGELLAGLQARHPSVGTVRSIGLFGVFELVRSRETMLPMAPFNTSSPELAALDYQLRTDGLYTMFHWNQVFTNPPLCITEEQLREGFAIIDKALDATDAAIA